MKSINQLAVCIEKQNKLTVHKKQIAMKSVVVMWISMINDLIKIQDKVEQRLNNLLKYSINYWILLNDR